MVFCLFCERGTAIGGWVLARTSSATAGTLSHYVHSSLKSCLGRVLQNTEEMSDDAAPAKRGRKPNPDKAEKNDTKVETKKRARKEVKAAEGDSNDEGSAPVKRGRGRPKGSTKKKNSPKNSPAKPKTKGTGRRGRPKKEEAKDSADEDGEENDAAEEEDD